MPASMTVSNEATMIQMLSTGIDRARCSEYISTVADTSILAGARGHTGHAQENKKSESHSALHDQMLQNIHSCKTIRSPVSGSSATKYKLTPSICVVP